MTFFDLHRTAVVPIPYSATGTVVEDRLAVRCIVFACSAQTFIHDLYRPFCGLDHLLDSVSFFAISLKLILCQRFVAACHVVLDWLGKRRSQELLRHAVGLNRRGSFLLSNYL